MDTNNISNLTPQEAALYYGQEVQYTDHIGYDRTCTIDGDVIVEFEDVYTRNVKLLLRPLSDIAEEEAYHLLALRGTRAKFDKVQAENGFISYQGTDSHDNRIEKIIGLNRLAPSEFAYLISKGFDPFGFIEAGKAIDKTKVAASS